MSTEPNQEAQSANPADVRGNLYISETRINATKGYRYSETPEPFETFTDDPGALYRDLTRDLGRCKGKVYIDKDGGAPVAVGWVFEKRAKYEDDDETYLQETWVTLHDAPDTIERTPHYHAIGGTP